MLSGLLKVKNCSEMIAGYTGLLLITLGIAFFLYMKRNFNYWKNRGVPYLTPVPIFGNMKDVCLWRTTIGELCKSIYLNTKLPFVGFFILDEPCLMITDLELVKNVLINDFENFQNRTMTNNEKHDGVGSNFLFLMKSRKWKDVRKKITRVFSSGKMRMMAELMLECGKNMVEYIHEKMDLDDTLEVRELSAKFAVESITSTAFGLKAGCFENNDAPFRVIAKRILNWDFVWHAIQTTCFFIAPKLVHLFRMKFIDPVSTDFFRNVFWKAMRERERTKFVRNDLLDILIEMKNTDQKNGKVLLETVRMYPILPFLDRRCTKRFKVPGSNLVLEEGDMVYIPVLGIHYDPKYFPEPNRFNPDRFDKINCEQRHSMAFLGFGDGPRNCIGRRYGILSTKSGLAHLLSNFKVNLCEKTDNNMEFNPKGFTLQPKNGIILQFEKLNSACG